MQKLIHHAQHFKLELTKAKSLANTNKTNNKVNKQTFRRDCLLKEFTCYMENVIMGFKITWNFIEFSLLYTRNLKKWHLYQAALLKKAIFTTKNWMLFDWKN